LAKKAYMTHPHRILARGAALLLAAAASAVLAQAPAPVLPADAAAVKRLVEQRIPGMEVRSIARTDILGLYEVLADDRIVYVDPKVNYLFMGSIYDMGSKQNLTEDRYRQLNRVDYASLPFDRAFKRVKGDGSRRIALFSDAECPFCARIEKELAGMDNVTIYTFLFPIDSLHPAAAQKSRQIWCAPDRVRAWDDWFASNKLPDNKGDCANPVAELQALTRSGAHQICRDFCAAAGCSESIGNRNV
jgi:thiol:disulfide interchange protein DsbC